MVLPCDPVKSNPKSTLSWGDRTYFADNDKTCKVPLASFSLVLLLCVYILYKHMKVIIYSYHYHYVIICPSRMNPWSIWINMDHCMIMVCWCLLMFVANAFNSWQVITSLRARLVPKTATAALMPPTKGAPLDFDHVFWGVVLALLSLQSRFLWETLQTPWQNLANLFKSHQKNPYHANLATRCVSCTGGYEFNKKHKCVQVVDYSDLATENLQTHCWQNLWTSLD